MRGGETFQKILLNDADMELQQKIWEVWAKLSALSEGASGANGAKAVAAADVINWKYYFRTENIITGEKNSLAIVALYVNLAVSFAQSPDSASYKWEN